MNTIKIALTGNPNSGKTSIFNSLTGTHQRVANYGGVTVEIKEATVKINNIKVKIIDLPGIYSLSEYSVEQKAARDYIVEQKPDVLIDVIDSTNLERNLYLTLQLLEMGIRPVLAFNMWDEVTAKGIFIDLKQLEKLLDVPIVTTVAKNCVGVNQAFETAIKLVEQNQTFYSHTISYGNNELDAAIRKIATHPALSSYSGFNNHWLAIKLLEHDQYIESQIKKMENGLSLIEARNAASTEIEKIVGKNPQTLIVESRYDLINRFLKDTLKKKQGLAIELTDKIDAIVTHRFFAFPIFLFFMWLVFQLTFLLGEYPVSAIEWSISKLGDIATAMLPKGILNEMVVNGIIAGVGNVAVFLPNILLLFLGISIMEDTGYIARATFITDRIMQSIGLHGKSFIPMIIGMGCSVPAIMATRTLDNKRDRIKTILLIPLISCSARLPVYVLFASALFPTSAGNVVFLFQFVLGIAAFFVVGFIFKHTLFKGEENLFIMEFPPYRLPTFRNVLLHMWQKTKHYLQKMGGIILVFSCFLWYFSSFPKLPESYHLSFLQQKKAIENSTELSEAEKESNLKLLQSEYQAGIILNTRIGKFGKVLEPLLTPIGFDWKVAVALVSGFIAKEMVISSLGILYGTTKDVNASTEELRNIIAQKFSPLKAIAFMTFVMLYTPCIASLIAIFREVKNWYWGVLSVTYQLALAWTISFLIVRIGTLLGYN